MISLRWPGRPRGAVPASVKSAIVMPQLLFTTAAFRPHGAALPDVPMLIDDDMALIEPACAWLMHIALVRGRTRSIATWRTYGEALYDWWQTLTANDWAWDRVGARELAACRGSMLNGARAAPGPKHARPRRCERRQASRHREAARKHAGEKRALATENLALLHRALAAEDTVKARDRLIARLEAMLRRNRLS